jgi:hypothetical protein
MVEIFLILAAVMIPLIAYDLLRRQRERQEFEARMARREGERKR